MLVIVIILVFLLGVIAMAGLAFWRFRNNVREAKTYERALKMVPLLIHLPPSSDDTEVGARDARDVTEETISKAQTLYNIISSTVEKGYKRKLHGQRHFAFEIIAAKSRISYYVAVPVPLISVVQQAVLSAYPTARLEETEEFNLFNPTGKISGTIGGEFDLKENYANPIATFQETKRDGMQAILNALSALGPEDGAGIQILVRPADPNWTKNAVNLAKDKTDNKGGGGGFFKETFGYMKEIPKALLAPPEAKDEDKKEISNLEKSKVDAIEEKTRHSGYETMIRVVASSNTAARSQELLNNVVAAFSLFDAPGKNGFKFKPAKDIEKFVSGFIFRFFPQKVTNNVLNSVELATIFHLPDQRTSPTSQLERQSSKQVDGPPHVPEHGTLLGYNIFRGVKKEIRLSDNDRRRHLYIVGQTGTGKSVLLENLALQDMLDGKGFAFIDPHGDAVDHLMSMVPKERTEDIIYFSPADMDYPMGLNLFEFQSDDQKDFLIQEAINMLYKLYDPQRQGIIGPRYEHWFRNAALTLMADPQGSTFIDIPKVFTDNNYMKSRLKYVKDITVRDFWEKEMAKTSDYHKSEVLGWFVSKFGAFMSNEMMRNIIGQVKSAYNLREIMDDGKILLVNLSKGKTGELNSKLLGMIFVMKFQAAAMSRANIPEDQRRDFSLYVDEFQNFSTDSFATILSEARKYRLNLIVANQFISQLTDEVRDAVFGNVGSVISLRTGANDADFLVKQFSPVFDTDDLVKLPNYNATVRLMLDGVPSQPFSMATIPPLGHPNAGLSDALKRLSAAKYGRPRAQVEKEIFARIKTKDEPARPKSRLGAGGARGGSPFGARGGAGGRQPRFGAGAGAPPRAGGGLPSAPAQRQPRSFMDDFMARRQPPAAGYPPQQYGAYPPAQQPPVYPQQPPVAAQPPAQPAPTSQPPAVPAQAPAPTQPTKAAASEVSAGDAASSKDNHAQEPKASPKDTATEPEQPDNASETSQKPAVSQPKPANSTSKATDPAGKQGESSNDGFYIDKDGKIHQPSDDTQSN